MVDADAGIDVLVGQSFEVGMVVSSATLCSPDRWKHSVKLPEGVIEKYEHWDGLHPSLARAQGFENTAMLAYGLIAQQPGEFEVYIEQWSTASSEKRSEKYQVRAIALPE